MTDKEKLEKVKAEIERRYKYNKEHENDWAGSYYFWQKKEDEEILSFIDSMQEEQVKESEETQHVNETCKENGDSLTQEEDLKEAAKHYLYSNILYDDVYVGNPTDKDCVEMFKAGANWQKEQMIAKAVSGHVGQTINGMLRALSDETFGDMGFTAGDKVKLIIIKEE